MASRAVHRSRGERGAALIIAVGVLTVLLVIGATFFRISQTELQVATNVTDQVRMDLMAEGATALAIAHLRQDRINNPTATSLDHPWNAYFNGSWAAGKPWMWQGDTADNVPADFVNGAIPVIRLRPDGTVPPLPPVGPNDIPDPPDIRFPRQADGSNYADPNDEIRIETNLGRLLYIPRVEAGDPPSIPPQPGDPSAPTVPILPPDGERYTLAEYGDLFDGDATLINGRRFFNAADANDRHPWVVARNRAGGDFGVSPVLLEVSIEADEPLLVEEQIDLWTDFDNDGDSLNDSVWLPVSAIRVLDNDGLDNNLNGIIDEPGELGLFFYRADNDGLDNDGDGIVDNEPPIMFTTHFRSWDGTNLNPINLTLAEWRLIAPEIYDGEPGEPAIPDPLLDVDVLDNDYTLIVNDRSDMARYLRRYDAAGDYVEGPYDTLNTLFDVAGGENIQVFAEPVSEIIGRMAVKITDISTKVNVNAAGGHVYTRERSVFPLATDFDDVQSPAHPLQRSFGDGLRITEYETQVLPDIGPANARWLWQYRMGAPQGDFVWDPVNAVQPDYVANWTNEYFADVSNPGYGFVDDNGDALWLSLNGLDDSGSGFPDDGLRRHDYGDSGGVPVYAHFLEGIDHPGEWQRFQPLRNRIAETDVDGVTGDPLPNTGIGDPDLTDGNLQATVANFLGELGDTYFRTHEVTKNIVSLADDTPNEPVNNGINATRFRRIEPFINVHSNDRNIRFSHALDQNILNEPRDRTVTGARLDINLAGALHIRDALVADFGYEPVEPEIVNAAGDVFRFSEADPVTYPTVDLDAIAFAVGLKRGDVTIEGFDNNARLLGVAAGPDERLRLRHDPRLRAAQLAVNTQDFRDADRVRAEISTFFNDPWWTGAVPREIEYISAGIEAVRINELMVRAVRRIEAEMDIGNPNRDPNAFSNALNGLGAAVDDDFQPIYDPAAYPDLYGRQMADHVEQVLGSDPGYDARETWLIMDENLMGLHSAWRAYATELANPAFIDPATTPAEPETFQNVIQFTFEASPQLPPGRYYLTINTVMPMDIDHDTIDLATANADLDPDIQDGDPSDDTIYRTAGDQTSIRVTATQPGDIYFATKYITNAPFPANADDAVDNTNGLLLPSGMYVSAGDTDIVEDLYEAAYDNTDFWLTQIWRQPILGYRDPGNALSGLSGWAFLPTDDVREDHTDIFTEIGDTALRERARGYFQDSAYTVEIPDPALAPGERPRLCVAFKPGENINGVEAGGGLLNSDTGIDSIPLIAINFFDFSQEPAHEYIELINIDRENPIDVGGWAVTVDGEVAPRTNDRRRVMTIPQNTTIAPGGTLLLVSNKQDVFATDPGEPNLLERNGMGALRDSGDPNFLVTVPDAGVVDTGVLLNKDFDADSVWTGTGGLDFVDNDGDGVVDGGDRPDDDVDSDGDRDVWDNDGIDNDGDGDIDEGNDGLDNDGDGETDEEDESEGTTDVGDRIIQLEIPEFSNVTDVQRLAQLVLGGGMFPNYPERDGIDNDLDNLILSADLVDNTGSGSVDDPNEGIDEGFRLHYLGHPATDTAEMPGGFGAPQLYRYDTGVVEVRDPDDPIDPGDPLDDFDYMGSTDDAPAFRAFQERRWYPGDNVIVTLYEDGGPGGLGGGLSRVVDRVTYNELDVINRSIDDLIEVTLDPVLQLDPDFTTFWPHDTMGIDFYKALERKHPLYNGDRFGTSNRWQATDGAYDDWADRTSRFERVLDFEFNEIGLQPRVNEALFNHAFNGSPLRANLSHRFAENLSRQFGNNDISDDTVGTDETPRQWAFSRVDVVGDRSRPMLRAPSQLMRAPHMIRKSYIQSRAQALVPEPGLFDIDSVNQLFEQDAALPVDTPVRQDRSIQQVLVGQTFPAPDAARVSDVQTGGPDDPEVEALRADLAALTSIFTAHTSQTLTAGRARVYPMWPFPLDIDLAGGGPAAQVGGVPDGYGWALSAPPDPTDPTIKLLPPSGWSPVHLWSLAGDGQQQMFVPDDPDSMRFATRYLMETPPSLVVDNERWPLDLRATMYVSANLPPGTDQPNEFSSATDHNDASGAEALFVWTGEDGLENGEYDVYVMLNEPIRPLNAAHLESDDEFGIDLITNDNTTDGITNFGRRFMQTTLANQASETSRETVLPEDVVVDIDFFTDRDGDRRVWSLPAGDLTPGIPKPGSLNDGMDDDGMGVTPFDPHPTRFENFGLQPGVSPGPDGIYRYPITVTVENNYLAMFLRNRTPSGNMVRFSRIILAPRDRTPGKLNINTIVTSYAEEQNRYMNTLTGIPGLNRHYDVVDRLLAESSGAVANEPGNSAPPQVGQYVAPMITFETPSPPFNNNTGEVNRALLGRVSKLALGRTDHVDGRYYNFLIDGALPIAGENRFNTVEIQEPDAHLDGAVGDEEPIFSSFSALGHPSTGDLVGTFEEQFDEVYERYTRTENLITTRSDIFEILVTVQTGTVTDTNGDGVLNYRDNNEFTITGERQMRTVYER